MRRKPRSTLLFSFAVFLIFAFQFSRKAFFPGAGTGAADLPFRRFNPIANYALREGVFPDHLAHRSRRVSSVPDPIPTVAILLPDWEILLISSGSDSLKDYLCLFQNNATSPANFSGTLDFTGRATFKCLMPDSVRRLRPFYQPVLTKSPAMKFSSPAPELLRWSFLAYEAFETEHDVVLFVKGVNHRQGTNRPPAGLKCVFGDGDDAVRTAVTSSVQEVFRCRHPDLTVRENHENFRIKISLEILDVNGGKSIVVPSVAYYSPPHREFAAVVAVGDGGIEVKSKSTICASTMVYNVGKFLKEWVIYYSKIGVERFVLYDNGSDDEIPIVVKELIKEGFEIEIVFWIWPKTQEAGFSHSVEYSKKSCEWMMFVDVDEFVFSPSWLNSLKPSPEMLKSLLPASEKSEIGMISVMCNDYGPSGRVGHPAEGVTQGYNCRRKVEERHKSIVKLEAVDPSLLNVIHHFRLKPEFRSKQMRTEEAVVNHYKYQAWPEFRMKFRRRVSAYVVDWKESANPRSKDRAPGLGNAAVEPPEWPRKFCEVRDDRLRLLTQRWFGFETADGYRMAWQ